MFLVRIFESSCGETGSLIFRLALGMPALAKLGSGSRGLAQDERGLEVVTAAGLKGLLHPLNGHSNRNYSPPVVVTGECFCLVMKRALT
jgi:hypothetical protein